jgi:biopolymer transport protein TolR
MKHRRRRRQMAEINIVPYIDVMLVLLVVFMITAPLINQGVEIDLPQAESEALSAAEARPLVLQVDRSGLFYLDVGDGDNAALDPATVITRAAAAIRRSPAVTIIVQADSNVEYQRVIEGISLLKRAGADTVGLATRPLED